MKKIVVMLIILGLSMSGAAFAADYKGKVEKVDGKMVTIKITKGKAADLKEGTKIEFEAEGGKPEKNGGGMKLMGC